jgi:hypothetical protein
VPSAAAPCDYGVVAAPSPTAAGCAAGVEVNYVEQPGAIHVSPLHPVPEGRAAREDVVARAGGALGLNPSP